MLIDTYHKCPLFAHKYRNAIHLRNNASKVHVIFSFCTPIAKALQKCHKNLACRKMEMEATTSNPFQGEMWVDMYGEISYASHAMPPKTKYPRTKPKSKMTTCDSMAMINSLEEVIELNLHKKPRALREAACGRMLNHSNEPQSTMFKFWNSNIPEFVVPMAPHCLEFVVACASKFMPNSLSM